MKVEGISPNFVKSMYRAAAALYRTDSWKRLQPGHLFGIRVGKDTDWSGKKQPFPCIQFIGGDGGDIGFNMFRSKNDAKKMTGSRETIDQGSHEIESLMFPSNRKMTKSLSLEASGTDHFPVIDVARCMSSGGLLFRNPTLEELRFVHAFMKAVSLVHPLLNEDNEIGPKYSTLAYFEPFTETVDVHWPPEMIRGGHDIVTVTVSHPPGQTFSHSR
ncbi:Zinc finger MYND domain-containing protein 15 [Quillaja saponaria]|uniref:Zinc finger MYND domain-containing protein 15 n=1 Tax=Quillaja saponaria TaxID=32244 RepID=A0AAD7P930_QUISA|nr:Zinc finger MYND domain-containing protein 15 [Quillaja saponaria]